MGDEVCGVVASVVTALQVSKEVREHGPFWKRSRV
jgi:hypothetical protein